MNNRKIDFINDAYSRARISGLTKQPSGADVLLALTRLEDMAALWQTRNICTGYNFEDSPSPNSPHNVSRGYWTAYKANLAMMILSDFGKTPMPSLVLEATGSLASLYSATAKTKEVPYPSRQPIGSGNAVQGTKQYSVSASVPISCEVAKLLVGDVNDYTEHFGSFLQETETETIASYTIESTNPTVIVLSNAANTVSDVMYRGTALAAGASVIRIQITTTLGRIKTNSVIFEVFEVPDA